MTRREQIEKNGYCVFDLNKENDGDAMTPTSTNYQAIVLCEEGEVTVEANMKHLTIEKDDCLCMNNILYKKTVHMSDDFSGKVLVCDRSFAFRVIVGVPTEYIELMYINPTVKIKDEVHKRLILNFFDTLDQLQNHQLELRHKEVVNSTFRSLILLMAVIRGGHDDQNLTFTQSDLYFRQFVEHIETHVKREHEVAFYAGKLSITSKYLNEVCKNKGGYKAKEMISLFLISKIKQEILMSGKSIKNIAYEYGFADQSSMGKFFTKMAGISPSEFKRTRLQVLV